MKLLLPIGGKSSRYNLHRPKWMLTLPSGKLMIEEAVQGLDFQNISSVVVIAIKDQFERFIDRSTLHELLVTSTNCPVEIIILNESTRHQPETVMQGLSQLDGEFPFLVKDCDNYFECTPTDRNTVYYMDLNDIDSVNPSNKSYLSFSNLGVVDRIIEKKVISSAFCVGGYAFASKQSFLRAYGEIVDEVDDMYLSHLIFHMIASGEIFYARQVSEYKDWGTLREYKQYQARSATLFLDFDGVLVENSSKFSSIPWDYRPILENLTYLSDFIMSSPASAIVITTSRPGSERNKIISFLAAHGIHPLQVVTDLPHCKRILINDFSSTNSYPSALSVSTPRNSNDLRSYLERLLAG